MIGVQALRGDFLNRTGGPPTSDSDIRRYLDSWCPSRETRAEAEAELTRWLKELRDNVPGPRSPAAGREARWAAVFGACVARQSFDWMAEGHGAPGDVEMRRFVEEAEAVADMADEAWDEFKKG